MISNFKRGEEIFADSGAENPARVLVAGIARVTRLNAHHQRVTVSLIAPGPLPELPTLAVSRFDFRCEAYNKCRVGTLDWNDFENITSNGSEAVFNRLHRSDLKYLYRLVRRTSGFFNLDLHELIPIGCVLESAPADRPGEGAVDPSRREQSCLRRIPDTIREY